MTGVRARGEDIRRYILENVDKLPTAISKSASDHFGVSRQAINKHLQRLTNEGALVESGNTRARTYKIAPLSQWEQRYDLTQPLEEHRVWEEVKPHLGRLPDNVMNIWHIGFTEMFNNAIEHSSGKRVIVDVKKTAVSTEMYIVDDGVGIFHKIQAALKLEDPRHAILELAKGKFTTDPKNHSGEGIFFTSRMFDSFGITSRGIFYNHDYGMSEEWIHEVQNRFDHGTGVVMTLHNHTARTARSVYDDYSSPEGGFTKTVVPVRLAKHGTDQLVSRSQAKRLLNRVEKFHCVVFDFKDVPSIGQGFADEIFRVFKESHPEIEFRILAANEEVERMISHVRAGGIEAGHGQLPLLPSG